MKSILWQWGPIAIHMYGLMIAIGFLCAYSLMKRNNSLSPLPLEHISQIALIGLLGALLGGRAYYVIQHWEHYTAYPAEILFFFKGGLVYYGAFLGIVISLFIYSQIKKIEALALLDFAMPFVALSQSFGRIGCLFNGCCYGLVSNQAWAISFPYEDISRHPSQLYSSVGLILLFIILLSMLKSRVPVGSVFYSYLVGYGFLRFVIEVYRGDQSRNEFGLTFPQVISVPLLVIGILGLVVIFWKRHRNA